MRRTTTAAIAATLLLTLTACSTSGEPEKVTVTVTQTVTAAPSANTSAAQDATHQMGATKDVNDSQNNVHITVQALAYQQPYKGPQPEAPQDFQGGDTWATADVKVCNVKGINITVSQFPWSLAYSDGTSINTTGSTGGDMPKPEFPMDKVVKPGRCARGLLAFPVPGNKRPERLVYQPEGSDSTEWAIPKA